MTTFRFRVGTANDDMLLGDGGPDFMLGYGGNDTLDAGAGDDRLYGGDNDDVLKGGAGGDWIDGGNGIDTADYSASAAAVSVDLLAGTAAGGDATGDTLISIENLVGSKYNDQLFGDAGANMISGGDGNDRIAGGAGGDALKGDDGIDTLIYATSNAGVNVDLGARTASGGHAAGDHFSGFENLVGSAHNDVLRGSGADNIITGGAGADTIDGGVGIDTADYTEASSGITADLFRGLGLGGDAQWDTFVSIENLFGSSHDDHLIGDNGANTIVGNGGDDFIVGGAGADTLDGGDGNDRIAGGAGGDALKGGAGNDTVSYSGSTSAIKVDLGTGKAAGGDAEGDSVASIENLHGSHYDDLLFGSAENNTIAGLGGNDTIDGRDGNDVLNGGGDNDVLTGGNGADTFVFNMTHSYHIHPTLNVAGDDRVTDFNVGEDMLAFYSFPDTSLDDLDIAQVGADTVIKFSLTNEFGEYRGDGSVTLVGVDVDNLMANTQFDFLFI